MLVDGQWTTRWYSADSGGRFVRPETRFRSWVTADGSSGFAPEAGRFHLYVSYACPWAHRTLIARSLCGLVDAVGLSVVEPFMGDDGWTFSDALGASGDAMHGASSLREVYLAAQADYTGRVTVPVLWDKETSTIVNNESREILRMFDTAFEAVARSPSARFLPDNAAGIARVDETIDAIYSPINNGVYRCGFATTQAAYDEAVGELFAALDHWDVVLGEQRYLCGDAITEADWCMFTTLVRFDAVYFTHFKCNVRRISDYPNLSGYLRELYQVAGVAETTRFDHIKQHYFTSHDSINPHRIVPAGPLLDLDAPHGRGGRSGS